ncbi:unnamed protein product [Amoebophrya sp. A25]|nr:unnamed protein product [Amoebophrya sp. A25]|eukprot:GSA25T00009913001.1
MTKLNLTMAKVMRRTVATKNAGCGMRRHGAVGVKKTTAASTSSGRLTSQSNRRNMTTMLKHHEHKSKQEGEHDQGQADSVRTLQFTKNSWLRIIPKSLLPKGSAVWEVSEKNKAGEMGQAFGNAWQAKPKQQDMITMYGRDVFVPRFNRLYGMEEDHIKVRVSGKTFVAEPIQAETETHDRARETTKKGHMSAATKTLHRLMRDALALVNSSEFRKKFMQAPITSEKSSGGSSRSFHKTTTSSSTSRSAAAMRTQQEPQEAATSEIMKGDNTTTVDQRTTEKLHNACVLNWYEHGEHYIGFHADRETTIDHDVPIITLSYGLERRFQVRMNLPENQKTVVFDEVIPNGALVIMGGKFQSELKHAVPKTKHAREPRMSVTIRRYHPSTASA